MKHSIHIIFATLLVSTVAVYAQFSGLTVATAESAAVRLDLRDGFGGRIVQGVVALSTAEGAVKCDGQAVGASWDTTKLSEGWHTLSCNGKTERVCVRNDASIRLEEGRIMDRSTWDNDVVHVVRNDVYVPNGVTLSISEGAIVKFAEDSRIIVEHGGKIAVNGGEELPIEFAQVADDSVGGNTDLQDTEVVNETATRIYCYANDAWMDNGWFAVNHVVVSTLPYLTVQPVRAMRQGGFVRIPVTVSGSRSTSFAVDWQTVDGTAKFGVDFTEKEGRVSWNSTSVGVRYIEIPLVAESQTDDDVAFTIRLTKSYGANIQMAEAFITIFNSTDSMFENLTVATAESLAVRLDLRDDFGGRIAQGVMVMSNTDGDVTLNGKTIGESWDTTKLEDGWVELSQGAETRDVAVLNTDAVHCEEGRLTENTTWDSSAVRLIRNDVYIPNGVTLTITEGTTVKFTEDTRIIVENGGKLQMNGMEDAYVQFAMATDDGYAGDTDMREAEVVFPANALIYNYSSGTVADNGYVASRGLVISSTYPSLTLHGTAVYEDCGTVYLPVTVSGTRNMSFYAEWTATDVTATFDEDYGLASGKLTWNSTNDGTKYIEIPVMAGHLAADEETFTVRLVASGGANITTNDVTVTIRKSADAGFDGLVHASVASEASRLDLREGFGGRIVRGTIDLSTTEGKVSLNGKELPASWNSTTSEDGWHELAQNGQTADICVLNNHGVALEEGRLVEDTTWDDSAVHLIRNDVYVPNGVTLTLTDGAVVKFTEDTRIIVENGGKISVQGAEDSPVQFALATDDTYGGDTDLRDGEMDVPSYSLISCYNTSNGWTDNGNLVSRQVAFNTLPTVSIHNSRVMEHEGVVMIPVTVSGTRKASFAVDWKAIDGTAKLNNDYTLSSGRVSWTSTDNGTRYIEIPIVSDAIVEELEDFTVVLTASSGTNVATAESTVSIVESEATLPADAEYACDNYEMDEGVEVDERTDWFSRLARDVETLSFSTSWAGKATATSVRVSVQLDEDNEVPQTIYATDEGETDGTADWETAGLSTGRYLLAHEIFDNRGSLLDRLETKFFINREVIMHEGRLTGDETWNDSAIHVVRANVIVPAGVQLTIGSGAIVKFQSGCGIIVKLGGIAECNGVTFTHIADDSIGGDTNLDGNATMPVHNAYSLTGVKMGAGCKLCYLTQTLEGGTISGTTTLMGNCVYHVTGNITVVSGGKLIVQPGTIVKMNSGLSITVNNGGTLEAWGNRAQPIVFTSIKDDEHGGDSNKDGNNTVAAAGDWGQITTSGIVNMNYCHILYPRGANNQGGLYNSGTLNLQNSEIAHSVFDCLRCTGGEAYIANSLLHDTSMGFAPAGGNNLIVNSIIYDTTTAVRWPSATFVNCIIAYSDQLVDTSFGTGMTFQNCLFWNDKTYGEQSCYAVGDNGNIWGDPLFVDPGNGNFTLRPNSPCIDAGDGSLPELPMYDYYGNPRSWSDGSVTPTGIADTSGNVPDIGLFEMCGDIDSDLDLIVNSVSGTTSAMTGELATIRWTVTNIGTASAAGARRDNIYLVSKDERLGDRRVFVTTATFYSSMASGDVKEYEIKNVKIPPVTPGRWAYAVFANEERDWFEGRNTDNNYLVSKGYCDITVPTVSCTSQGESMVVASGETVAIQLMDVPAKEAMLVIRGGGALNITGASGHVPETFTGGWQTIKLESGVALLRIPPLPEGQETFLLLENEGNEDVQIEFEVLDGAFALFDNGKTTVAFPGFRSLQSFIVTLPIYGIGLSENMEAYLMQGNTRVDATSVMKAENGVFYAVFEIPWLTLESSILGDWMLYVSNENGSDSLEALTIVSSNQQAHWYCRLELPSAVRRGRTVIGTFVYGNSGEIDMDAPYVRIEGDTGVNVRLSENDAWGKTIEFMALSASYPVSRLRAGEERRQTFQFIQLNDADEVNIKYEYVDGKLYMKTDPPSAGGIAASAATDKTRGGIQVYGGKPEPFPWDENGKLMRPDWATDSDWKVILNRLKEAIGPSWDSCFDRMRANADYLALLGQGTNDLAVLWQMDVREALAVDNVVSTLASSTDLVRGGRGFNIVVSRRFGTSLKTRSHVGAFGKGWAMSYETRAVLKDEGETLAFEVPSGSSYTFSKISGSWYSTVLGDKTQLEENDNEYILRYRDGSVAAFSKASGRMLSMRDCNVNGLNFNYTDEKLVQVTHTDGQWVKFSYNGEFIMEVQDDLGHVVSYTYNENRLVSSKGADDLVTEYIYDNKEKILKTIIYPDGTTRDYTFDNIGRVATISRNGNQQTVTIDRGRFGSYAVIDTDGAVWEKVVGALGEVLYTVDALANKTIYKYDDDVAVVTAIQTATGRVVHYEYDKDFNITRAIAPDGTSTSFAYSVDFGGLERYTDARGQSVMYSYDEKGQGVGNSLTNNNGGSLEYNDHGDIVSMTWRNGKKATLDYDAQGRLISTTDADNRSLELFYDTKGNIEKITDSQQGDTMLNYTAEERLKNITYADGRGFSYEYDNVGRLIKQVYSDGFEQCYEYDTLSRVSRMTDKSGNLLVSLEYDVVTGMIISKIFGNGTSVHYSYDLNGNVLSIIHKDKNGNDLEKFQYTYDADGRRTQVESSEGMEIYTYDLAGQLTDVTYPDGSTESFTYDAIGNRVTANGETYTVNELNQVLSAGDATFTYDDNGNMSSRTDASGTTRYEYDANSRLIRIVSPDGKEWSCQYDALGNRSQVNDNGQIRKQLYTIGSLSSLAAEYNASGKLTRRYVLLNNELIADIDYSGNYRYYHGDCLGSARLLTNSAGAVVSRQSYNAFGGLRMASGEAIRFGFVGTYGVESDTTRFVFMRNRYYDTAIGRFTQMDPIGVNAGDVNWYRYCGNSPSIFIDTLGYFSQDSEFIYDKNAPICRDLTQPYRPRHCPNVMGNETDTDNQEWPLKKEGKRWDWTDKDPNLVSASANIMYMHPTSLIHDPWTASAEKNLPWPLAGLVKYGSMVPAYLTAVVIVNASGNGGGVIERNDPSGYYSSRGDKYIFYVPIIRINFPVRR